MCFSISLLLEGEFAALGIFEIGAELQKFGRIEDFKKQMRIYLASSPGLHSIIGVATVGFFCWVGTSWSWSRGSRRLQFLALAWLDFFRSGFFAEGKFVEDYFRLVSSYEWFSKNYG